MDDEEILDEIISEMNGVAKHLDEIKAEVIRRAEEGHIEIQNSIANLHQCVNMLGERCRKQGTETSCSRDSQSQTHHTRDDEPGLPYQKDSCPAREGHEQNGQVNCPSNEPDDKSQRLPPQNSQRNLDEETLVDIVARSQ